MSLKTITAPAAHVFGKDDDVLRAQLRLMPGETDQDALLTELIVTAEAAAESYTRLRLITQTVRVTLDGFGCGGIALPVEPVQSVVEVSYIDGAGDVVTMDAADYRLVSSETPCELHPAYGQSWPVPRDNKASVFVDLVVGFGAAASDVPAEIRGAIRLHVGHGFLNREAVVPGVSVAELPLGFKNMLDPWRFWV